MTAVLETRGLGRAFGALQAVANVGFTVGGLGSNTTGTVTFSDGNGHSVTFSGIGNGLHSGVNLSGLDDGPITATLKFAWSTA